MALFRGGVRWIMVGALLLTAVAAALVLALALALDHRTLGAAAEARLSAMLGEPVTIGAIRFSLFPRLALTGSEIRVGAATNGAPAVELRGVHIVPRLRSLIRRPVVVEVGLDGLIVSVLRDTDGRWHVPPALPGPTDERDAGVVIERVRVDAGRVIVFEEIAGGGVREASGIDDLRATVELAAGGLQLSSMTGRVGNAAIAGEARSDAHAAHLKCTADAIADEDLSSLLRLAGGERPAFLRLPQLASASVTLRIDRATSRLSGTGSLRAPEIVLDRLRLERFDAPFSVDGARVILDPAAFGVYGGSHTGVIAVDFTEAPPHWSMDSRLSAVDVGNLLNALTTSDARLDGTAVASAALRGRLGEPLDRTLQGRGHVAVTNGILREFPLLAFINSALRLAQGDSRDTRFERLAATLAFGGGGAATDDLMMQAGHVHVLAAGRIGTDRSLALSGHAVVSAERSAEAIRSIHELSALRNARGELELPLRISGTLDDPSFDLDLKAAFGKSLMDELRRRLPGIIRRPQGAPR